MFNACVVGNKEIFENILQAIPQSTEFKIVGFFDIEKNYGIIHDVAFFDEDIEKFLFKQSDLFIFFQDSENTFEQLISLIKNGKHCILHHSLSLSDENLYEILSLAQEAHVEVLYMQAIHNIITLGQLQDITSDIKSIEIKAQLPLTTDSTHDVLNQFLIESAGVTSLFVDSQMKNIIHYNLLTLANNQMLAYVIFEYQNGLQVYINCTLNVENKQHDIRLVTDQTFIQIDVEKLKYQIIDIEKNTVKDVKVLSPSNTLHDTIVQFMSCIFEDKKCFQSIKFELEKRQEARKIKRKTVGANPIAFTSFFYKS
ncbi:MAG: hypothetical protein R2831_09195 [Chitinophagaceae bacterium]